MSDKHSAWSWIGGVSVLTALNIAYAAYEPARYMRILPGLTELVPLFAMVAAAVMLGPFIGGLIAAFLSPES